MDNRYGLNGNENIKISSDLIVNKFGGIQNLADGLMTNMLFEYIDRNQWKQTRYCRQIENIRIELLPTTKDQEYLGAHC